MLIYSCHTCNWHSNSLLLISRLNMLHIWVCLHVYTIAWIPKQRLLSTAVSHICPWLSAEYMNYLNRKSIWQQYIPMVPQTGSNWELWKPTRGAMGTMEQWIPCGKTHHSIKCIVALIGSCVWLPRRTRELPVGKFGKHSFKLKIYLKLFVVINTFKSSVDAVQ